MGNQFLTVAAQQINYRNFDHGITSGLLFHGGACHANQHLRGKSRIINLHVKLRIVEPPREKKAQPKVAPRKPARGPKL